MTGFVPARLSIFKLAFSHKSNQATKDYAQTNNERLEYLGDAVLGTIVAEYLFKKYPNGDEGFLTKMRSKIVKRKSLNDIGDKMGLDVLLTEYNRTRLSSSMLGNAVEALVGAVYLEKGYRGTERFVIQRMLKLYVDMHELETVDDNYKSQLLEYCQKNGMQVSYKLLNKFKQDRRDRFKVAVMVNGEQVSLADDFNKKSAEQLASLRALKKLGLIDKDAPIETGRKSPPKEAAKVDRTPKRAQPERKVKAKAKSPTNNLANVSDEQIAVAAISKRQAVKPTRVKEEKPKPAVAAKKAKAAPIKAKPVEKKSSAVMPARKQRRNSTPLGRSVWNGIQTAGTSISLTNELGYFEKQEKPQPAKPSSKPKKKASAAKQHTEDKAKNSNVKPSKQKAASTAAVVSSTKAKPRTESNAASVRKHRPIPLRILTPIVKDASAVMAIDFAAIFGTSNTDKRQAPANKKTATRKPRKKPAASNAPASKEKAMVEESWEDTPLGLSPETGFTPKPKASPRKEKAAPKQEKDLATEEPNNWEDTLLEITSDGDDLASELPDMYKKSTVKAPTNRRRPQRRSTNRKKKTEE